MKLFDDLISSIQGNVKTKANDPIIGAFIVSWIVCNWDRIALLFFGKGDLDTRINIMSTDMGFFANPILVFSNYDLLLLPMFLTWFYVFIMPKISVEVDKRLAETKIAHHSGAVNLEIDKAKKQRELNAEILRGDPNKEFLDEDVKNQLAIEKALVEKAQAEAAEAEAKKKSEESKAKMIQADAKVSLLEEQKKQRQSEQEKMAFSLSESLNKASIQANSYISSFLFVNLLSKSVSDDDVVMSLNGLTRTIAAVFGYENYDQLLNDKKFNNDNLQGLKYIVWDTDHLSKELLSILSDEAFDIDHYDSEWLSDHIQMIFKDLPYEFVQPDSLAELVFEQIEENSYDLTNEEGFSSAQAETDTIVDDIELYDKSYEFHDGVSFVLTLKGHASGHHRKEADMPGRGISFSVEATSPVVIGRFGLSVYETEIYASPEEYWEDEEE